MKVIKKSRYKPWKYGNCVLYARRKARKFGVRLPYGLWNLRDKKKIINISTDHPRRDVQAGDVAIMAIGRWGHVGVVYKVSKRGKVYIKEANWRSGRRTQRKGKQDELRIIGYYR